MNNKDYFPYGLKVTIEIGTLKFVKVKAHVRNINGKPVKVRQYYRRVLGTLK